MPPLVPACRFSALSIAPAARSWLMHTRQARVLHIFDRACNLINDRGEVLSVVAREIGNGPFNIVVEDNGFAFSNYIDARFTITVLSGRVCLGEVIVDTHHAKLWSPQPGWEQLHSVKENIIQQLLNLNEWIQARAPANSLIELLPSLPITNYQSLISNSLVSASTLCTAVAAADLQACRAATQQLAGLGAGLTPAGDDFILGAIYAAWIIHPMAQAAAIAEAITTTAIPMTTSLSAAWLKAGSRGEANSAWHDLLTTLCLADLSASQLPINHLLSIGHTSGADALAGFLASFLCLAELRMDQCLS